MARYLSPAWIADLDALVAADPTLGRVALTTRLEVAVRVTGTPDGDVAYSLRAVAGVISVGSGGTDGADVELTTDYATARAIATNTMNAQVAFLSGRLRLEGDLDRLIACQPVFAALDAAVTALRDKTAFD